MLVDTEDALPCPFCLNTDFDPTEIEDFERGVFAIVCHVCGAEGPMAHVSEPTAQAYRKRLEDSHYWTSENPNVIAPLTDAATSLWNARPVPQGNTFTIRPNTTISSTIPVDPPSVEPITGFRFATSLQFRAVMNGYDLEALEEAFVAEGNNGEPIAIFSTPEAYHRATEAGDRD